jgi:hypothetical protein
MDTAKVREKRFQAVQTSRIFRNHKREVLQQQAHLIAALLNGVWRKTPPKVSVKPKDITGVVPPLVQLGVSALVWRAIAADPLLNSEHASAALRNAHHYTVLQSATKTDALAEVAALLSSIQVDLLIFKGWAVAQNYGDPDVRPLGDFDVCVPSDRLADASALLSEHSDRTIRNDQFRIGPEYGQFHFKTSFGTTCVVDLHRDLDKFALPPLATLFERSDLASVGGVPIRMLRAEDHLRLVIMHFLIHGGWRPLWLTDICALLENVQEFDWEQFFGSDERLIAWFMCIIELAHRLLGARIDHVPSRYRVARMPAWLERTVRSEWQLAFAERLERPPIGPSMFRALPNELWIRWPNAIRIAMERERSVHRPPLLSQFADFSRAARRWARRERVQGSSDVG